MWLIAGMAASAQVSVLLENRNKTTGGGVGVVAGHANPWNRIRSGDWSRRAFAGRSVRPASGAEAGSH